MSEDFEDLLRAELAQRAGHAPTVIDEGPLVEAAIAGAGRIRRRRRISAAASGMGLIVLGAAVVVWQPWIAEKQADDPVASTTTEAQDELSMEFVVQRGDSYNVLNENGDYVDLGIEEEPRQVSRIQDAYLVEADTFVSVVAADGTVGPVIESEYEDFYTEVNGAADRFAVVQATDTEYTSELYTMASAPIGEDSGAMNDVEWIEFETSAELTLEDWDTNTAVFGASLTSVSGGGSGTYYFDEKKGWGLESVGAAGFESAVMFDYEDPGYVCVADLEAGAGLPPGSEECGQADAPEIQELMFAAANEDVSELVAAAGEVWLTEGHVQYDEVDLGDLEDRYIKADRMYWDPMGRWEIAYRSGDDTWMLITLEDDDSREGKVSELTPPSGALMPVQSYIP